MCFFSNDTATTEIYTLSLHDALPILRVAVLVGIEEGRRGLVVFPVHEEHQAGLVALAEEVEEPLRVLRHDVEDRKSTRLNSSHGYISYAVFCLKKKKKRRKRRS